MKAHLPNGVGGGPNNMQAMLRQAQKMQDDMALAQAELEAREYSAQAGGGAVSATVNGHHQVTALAIKPEVIDPDDAEMLADLVMAAVNEASRLAAQDAEQEMGKITGGMNLPGMF